MKKILSLFILLSLILASQSFAKIPPPPNLQLPANHATDIPVIYTFQWSDLPPATLYAIQIYDDQFNLVVNHTNLALSEYTTQTGELTGSMHYNWHARAVNGPDTAWTGFWDFTTANPPPPAPVLVYPANNATNIPVILTFLWSSSSGANWYHIQVSTDQNFGTTTIDVNYIYSTQYTNGSQPLANGTVYYWRVYAVNSGGPSPASTVWHFSTASAPPPAPTLQSPPNHATGVSLTPLLTWNPVTGWAVDQYHLLLASDAAFNNIIIDITTPNNVTQYQVPSPLGGSTTYYWHVQAHNSGGWGNYSSPTWDFTTMPGPPAAPVLISPSDSADCQSRNPQFNWSAVPTATSYLLQVGTDPSFTTGIAIAVVVSSPTYTPPANALNTNTKYYWRVRASNSSGTGPFSDIWLFWTLPPAPSVPALVYPCSQSGIPLSFTFRWNRSTSATEYQLQVSVNSGFTNVIFDINVPDTFYTIGTGHLQGGVTYYWHVRARNCTTQVSNYSTACNFTTLTTLQANIKVYLEGFYNPIAQNQVLDTIDVILANATSPNAFRDSSMIYLSSSGTGVCSFGNAPSGSYYIVIHHRNHLETWSSAPVLFATGTPANYDFTTGLTKAYGSNMKQIGSICVLYGGDINQDGQIFGDDYTILVSQFGKDGYISSDLNGDTFVDGYDLPIIYSNFFITKKRP